MLQPETSEVVEVFTGDSLEQAMAYAVAALGPDLVVRRARKVRKGVPGLVGRDRYEVVAAPPTSPTGGDAVASAFDALLSRAEEREQAPRVRRTTRQAPRVSIPHPSPAVADHVARARFPVLERSAKLVEDVFDGQALEPMAAAAPAPRARVKQPVRTVAEKPAPVAPKAAKRPAAPPAAVGAKRPAAPPKTTRARAAASAAPKKAPAKRSPRKAAPAPTGWSRDSLVRLGLPAAVLAALPAKDPADDLAWTVALAVALGAALREPAALSATNPLVVHGHGLKGVLGLIDAATRGLTPGTITAGERTAPATATELALVVRAALVG